MIAVVQRVIKASVWVEDKKIGSIEKGVLLLLGIEKGDEQSDLDYIIRKTAGLRIFPSEGKMTKSVTDIGAEILVVSQFTLAGDVRRGKRPDFSGAANADCARQMYEKCVESFRELGIKTASGKFGADMRVDMSGDGPVTILLHSKGKY